ncbi:MULTISPECIES: hypothetical protein [unclassified Variovorax]|uniref:hypothetical protein n=1 Tax=unclassified Variovorax TaxID=663243 RepID=UPI003ECCCF73
MNRFTDLLNSIPVGRAFSLYAKDIGMEPEEFHDFVSSSLNTSTVGYTASNPHQENESGFGRYDLVVITRTE